jgi:hypothetical protein
MNVSNMFVVARSSLVDVHIRAAGTRTVVPKCCALNY